jgi:hypothetical protein
MDDQDIDKMVRQSEKNLVDIEERWLAVSPSPFHVALMVLLAWFDHEKLLALRDRINGEAQYVP